MDPEKRAQLPSDEEIESLAHYQPSTLVRTLAEEKQRLAPAYGIGRENGALEFGMTHGPFPELIDCLEHVGTPGDAILLLPDCIVLWAWDESESRWLRLT